MAALSRFPQALLLAALAVPSWAAAAPCAVDAPADADDAWAQAMGSVRALELSEADCVSLRIELQADRARVLLTTRDGRTAERIVARPEELEPTIDALRVQAPAPPPEPVAPVARPEPPKPAPQPETASDDDVPVRFALLTGARGGADSLVSPLLSGALSLTWRALELGATLSSELQYVELEGQRPADRQGSTAALGVHAGARSPWGGVDVLAGGRAAVAMMLTRDHESGACSPDPTSCPLGSEDERVTEWRFGAYAGIAAPRRGSLRFRGELGAELATPGPEAGSLPLTPSWALSALLGIELEP